MSNHHRECQCIRTTGNCRISPYCSSDLRHFTPTTFDRAWVAYVQDRGNPRLHIDPRLLARIGPVLVHEIDQALIDKLALELWPHATAQTRNRACYTVIGATLKYSARQGWCAHWRVRRPRLTKKAASPLPSKQDLWKFIHACAPHLKHIVIFLLRTGATVAETLRLDWRDVDLTREAVRLTNPAGRTRVATLDALAIKMLDQTPAALRHGYVFLTPRGKPYATKSNAGGHLKSALSVAWRKSGVRITPSVLKRVWRSRRAGAWPETTAGDGRGAKVVSDLMLTVLTKYSGTESNAPAN